MDPIGTITFSGPTRAGGEPIDLVVPQQLGSVALIREIGRGGMGVVWLGHDQMLARDVAVKFITVAKSASSTTEPVVTAAGDPVLEQFIEGARAAAAIRSPRLTAIHHAGIADGVPFLVMEYADGPSLSQVLRHAGPLSPIAATWVMLRICEAIAALHDEGAIHRDIKPANVLIDRDRGPLVTDFGLSVHRPYGEPSDNRPQAPTVAGTPAYMAPECFSGTVTLRSDVYALGIVFYELLSAQPPFHSDSLSELERLQRDQPINLAPLTSAGVPECLTHIIERATQKDAKLRPRSARHIAELITHTSEGRQAEKEGELEFRKALSRVSGGGPANAEAKGDAVTYYDHLSKRALAKKSRSKQQSVVDAGAPDAPDADAALAQRADQIAGREKTPASFPSIPVIPCPACGYNRRGVPPNVPCPECGFLSQIEPKPSDDAAHSVQPDSSDRIRISPSQVVPKSLLCIHCNYDLRGVSPAVACPECGEPLAKSLSMQRLIFADPHRVRSIFLGATVIAVPLLFNAFVFPMLPSALVKNSQPFNPTLAWLELGLAVVAAIGAVLLTPTRVVASSLFIDTLGWFIRVLSIVALGLTIALIAAHGPMPILIGSLMASQALFFCFVAAHTSAVAQRADDHKLVKHANSCSSVWILTLAAAAIGFVLDGVRPPPDSANVRSDIGMMLVTSAIAVAFITALYQIGVLVRFCRTLKSCRANHVPPPHTWGKSVA